MRALVILLLCVYCSVVSCYDKAPVNVNDMGFSRSYKPIAAAAAIAGLAIGKKAINGPNFNEDLSLQGKTAVITGGNTGLGKETAVKLAGLGADTIILCRTPNRAQAAVDEIVSRSRQQSKQQPGKVSYLQLDLADLKSVDKCSQQLHSSVDNINMLVNNAGVMAIPKRELTADGFEKHLGINHLGHFALTGKLMDLLRKPDSPGSFNRIINVSSAAHLLGKLDKTDLMLERGDSYGPWLAYGNSKLANILFTKELSKRLQSSKTSGSDIVTLTCHPGGCRTELGRYIVDPDSIPKYLYPVLGIAAAPLLYFTKSSEEGAQTQIYLSASSKITPLDSGRYYDNSAPADVSSDAKDGELANWLWEQSEKLTGVKIPTLSA